MLQVDSKVMIKDNAFPASDEPEDVALRGKFGKIVDIDGELIQADISGNISYLVEDEVEELPDGTLLYDDFEAVLITDRYKAALLELLAAEVEMMQQGDDSESWYYGRVTVGNLANNRNLEFEFGSEADTPDDGLGQFGIIIK